MRLFWMEVKKIFSWKLLVLIGLVNFLLFYLLLSFELEVFPNGPHDTELLKIEKQLIPAYGNRIDEVEFEEIKTLYAEQIKAADVFFENDDRAQQLGISNYREFRETDISSSDFNNYNSELMFESDRSFLWGLQAWESLVGNYESEALYIKSSIEHTSGSRQAYYEKRLLEEQFSFYSMVVLQNFKSYKTNMAIIILISVALLVSPVFLRDVQAGMLPIQYTSKKGRTVYRTKWFAGLTSATILTAVLLAIYMGLYATNDTSSHFGLPLTSFSWYHFWYDLTFLQYILLSVGVIFLSGILLGVLSMAISTIVPNTIVLIGIQIVTLFTMIVGLARYLVQHILDI